VSDNKELLDSIKKAVTTSGHKWKDFIKNAVISCKAL